MRKVIVAINLTLDGFCDHTAVLADDELHKHYSDFFDSVDISMMGRITYQLMESYWPMVVRDKVGTPIEIEFAEKLESLEKIVVTKTLESVSWNNSRIIKDNIIEELTTLKSQKGKAIAIGGPTLISYLAKQNMIDEFNLVIHPLILGNGIRLITDLPKKIELALLDSKIFNSGVVSLHYAVKR